MPNMDIQLFVICILTGGISLIGILAYASRIAGVRTRRIAISFSLSNILVLISRTSNSFLGPFLAKRIETRISGGSDQDLILDFRIILAAGFVAVLAGILLIPTAQRLFTRAIGHFQIHRSTARMIACVGTPTGLKVLRGGTYPSES